MAVSALSLVPPRPNQCLLPHNPSLAPFISWDFSFGKNAAIRFHRRASDTQAACLIKSSLHLLNVVEFQAKALAPPLSMTSISSADRTERRKRAGNSSRSKYKPLAGSTDPSAAAGAAPIPSSLRRLHVFWRGPYCWDLWRYSENE